MCIRSCFMRRAAGIFNGCAIVRCPILLLNLSLSTRPSRSVYGTGWTARPLLLLLRNSLGWASTIIVHLSPLPRRHRGCLPFSTTTKNAAKIIFGPLLCGPVQKFPHVLRILGKLQPLPLPSVFQVAILVGVSLLTKGTPHFLDAR